MPPKPDRAHISLRLGHSLFFNSVITSALPTNSGFSEYSISVARGIHGCDNKITEMRRFDCSLGCHMIWWISRCKRKAQITYQKGLQNWLRTPHCDVKTFVYASSALTVARRTVYFVARRNEDISRDALGDVRLGSEDCSPHSLSLRLLVVPF